jgi:hypothetical protein
MNTTIEKPSTGNLLLGVLLTLGLFYAVGMVIHSALGPAPKLPHPVSTNISEPLGDALARIYFDINSAELPSESGGAIQTVKEKAEAEPQRSILISGFHDPSGDPEQNVELAINRALAAKKALVAAGIPAARIKLRPPQEISGNADLQEARRVDLWVQ